MDLRWAVAGALALASCGVAESVDGSVEAAVAEYDASWTMTPTTCASGERQSFFGVDLLAGSDQSTLVRVLRDPMLGDRVGTNVPGADVSVWLTAADGCAVFDVDLVRQSSRINEIWNMSGHAIVECDLPGLRFVADLEFGNCH